VVIFLRYFFYIKNIGLDIIDVFFGFFCDESDPFCDELRIYSVHLHCGNKRYNISR